MFGYDRAEVLGRSVELLVPDGDVPETTPPTDEQVRLLREEIDPDGLCKREAGVK